MPFYLLLLLMAAVMLPSVLLQPAQAVLIPTRTPLPKIQRISVDKPGDGLDLILKPEFVEVYWIKPVLTGPPAGPELAAKWLAPVWQDRRQTQPQANITAPALIIRNPVFRIKDTNQLPFQRPCSCDGGCNQTDPASGANCIACQVTAKNSTLDPLGVVNGNHDLHDTNVHTHGLKVDVGRSNVTDAQGNVSVDACAATYNKADVCAATTTNPASTVTCQLYGDDVFADVLSGGMSSVNTYFLPNTMPGMHWYHHHKHGSVAYINPTSHGMLLVPDINPYQLFAPKGARQFRDYMGVQRWYDWNAAEDRLGDKADRWTQNKFWTWDAVNQRGRWDDEDNMINYNKKAWIDAGATPTAVNDCKTFLDILRDTPNFHENTEIIDSAGLWLRKKPTTGPTVPTDPYDDDTIPFIARSGAPPSSLLVFNDTATSTYQFNETALQDKAGRDFYPWNGVIQPTLTLEAGRWKRWLLLGSHTMKWKDITIREMPVAGGQLGPPVNQSNCQMWLLGWDGVYFENLPRFPLTTYVAQATPEPGGLGGFINSLDNGPVNNLVLGPATRADVLIRCKEDRKYVIVSGRGPYVTNNQCKATHCELVGQNSPYADSRKIDYRTGNNAFNGTDMENGAVLAVLDVVVPDKCKQWRSCQANKAAAGCNKGNGKPPPGCEPHPDLMENVCRTRVELYSYTDWTAFNKPAEDQCWNLADEGGGNGCNVNGAIFGNNTLGAGVACMDQNRTQLWTYEGIVFHPFHLHETPVRTETLPTCLNFTNPQTNQQTNLYQVGDWQDTVFIPMCYGVDASNSPEQAKENRLFLATPFPAVPKDFSTPIPGKLVQIANKFLQQYECLQQRVVGPLQPRCRIPANKDIPCAERFSVLHCHHLSHEDEKCIALVWWNCFTDPPNNQGFCPEDGFGKCPLGPVKNILFPNVTQQVPAGRRALRSIRW